MQDVKKDSNSKYVYVGNITRSVRYSFHVSLRPKWLMALSNFNVRMQHQVRRNIPDGITEHTVRVIVRDHCYNLSVNRTSYFLRPAVAEH